MANAFDIQVTGNEALTRRLFEIGEDAPKAASRAINHTLAKAKTFATVRLTADLEVSRRAIDRSLRIERATFSRQIGTLAVGGYLREDGQMPHKRGRIPLLDFRARGPEPSRGRGPGVSYRLPGGAGRVRRGFIATMRSGHRGVFAREGIRSSGQKSPGAWGPNLPIIELFGPSPQRVFRIKILADAIAKSRADLVDRLNHELNYILSQRVPAGDGMALAA